MNIWRGEKIVHLGVNTSFNLYIQTTFEKLLKLLISGVTETRRKNQRTSHRIKNQFLGCSRGFHDLIISRILRESKSIGSCQVPPNKGKQPHIRAVNTAAKNYVTQFTFRPNRVNTLNKGFLPKIRINAYYNFQVKKQFIVSPALKGGESHE